jgi:hypothetical protein
MEPLPEIMVAVVAVAVGQIYLETPDSEALALKAQ